MNNAPAKFDQYAESYAVALETTLAATGEDSEFYARGRIKWLAQCLAEVSERPRNVMDFGCGPGSSTPAILELVGCESLVGIDVSEKCIEQAKMRFGSTEVQFAAISAYQPRAERDLVYCNGVFHHISPAQRAASFSLVSDSLRPGGLFSLWENNPWNPGTRYCMAHCAFDDDAITISPLEARSLLRAAGFELVRQDFLFYFPASLRWFRRLEPLLVKLPLGGQYQVLCRKPL